MPPVFLPSSCTCPIPPLLPSSFSEDHFSLPLRQASPAIMFIPARELPCPRSPRLTAACCPSQCPGLPCPWASCIPATVLAQPLHLLFPGHCPCFAPEPAVALAIVLALPLHLLFPGHCPCFAPEPAVALAIVLALPLSPLSLAFALALPLL